MRKNSCFWLVAMSLGVALSLDGFAQGDAPAAKAPVTLRIVGSNVKNAQGEYLGRIQDIILNPYTSQTEFAMLLVGYPKNTTRVTPIPWSLLTHISDQGQAGGQPGADQVFQLNIDRNRLLRAPTLDKTRWNLIGQPEWRQQIYTYYGISTQPQGMATASAPEPAPQPVPYPVPVGPVISSSSSSSYSYAFADSDDPDAPPDDYGLNPYFPGTPYFYPYGLAGGSTIPPEFPPLWPGGTPVLPNGPDMFRAATNFFPGAPARLPNLANQTGIPGQPLVPVRPGSAWSPLLPANANPLVPLKPGSAWSPLVPGNSTPLVPVKPGSPWSPLVPPNSTPLVPLKPGSPWSPLVPPGSVPNVAVKPNSPWSPLVPPGSTPNVAVSPGSAWSPLVPPGSAPSVAVSPGSAWSPVVPQGTLAANSAVAPGAAWSPLVSAGSGSPNNFAARRGAWSPALPPGSVVNGNGIAIPRTPQAFANNSAPQVRVPANLPAPAFGGAAQGGGPPPWAFARGPGPARGPMPPPMFRPGLAPRAPLAPLAPLARRR